MYYITYTSRGAKCKITRDEWNDMTDKAQKRLETMCEKIKARLIIK